MPPDLPTALEQQLDLLSLDDLRSAHNRRALEAAIRRRCHTVAIDPHTTLCRILGRYKMFVDCRDEGLAPHLMLDGYWEFWLSDFMWRHLAPGNVAYDLGANLGYYTMLMADLVGPAGRVTAFEPNPRLGELLQRNIAINGFSGWVDRRSEAASDRSGQELTFHAQVTDPKNGRLLANMPSMPAAPGFLQVRVRTLALDDFADRPADFIKIDVEGAEEQVWRGMQRLIDGSPNVRILLEFNALRCGNPNGFLDQIADRFPLRELGFDAGITPVERPELLSRTEDTMLYLSALEPLA